MVPKRPGGRPVGPLGRAKVAATKSSTAEKATPKKATMGTAKKTGTTMKKAAEAKK